MKWGFPFIPIVLLFASIIAAFLARNDILLVAGLFAVLLVSIALYFIGARYCRCPKCNQLWWSPISLGMGWLSIMMDEEVGGDETESFRCRKCGLEIGPHLK